MTEAEADTLRPGRRIYLGAHEGRVIRVTAEEVTILWEATDWRSSYKTTYAKSCQMANMTLARKSRARNKIYV